MLTALGNAFFHLATTADPVEALVRTIGAGGDTDTNAAVAGALLGAAEGRAAWPVRWSMPVLTCRPDAGSWGWRARARKSISARRPTLTSPRPCSRRPHQETA